MYISAQYQLGWRYRNPVTHRAIKSRAAKVSDNPKTRIKRSIAPHLANVRGKEFTHYRRFSNRVLDRFYYSAPVDQVLVTYVKNLCSEPRGRDPNENQKSPIGGMCLLTTIQRI